MARVGDTELEEQGEVPDLAQPLFDLVITQVKRTQTILCDALLYTWIRCVDLSNYHVNRVHSTIIIA